MPVQELLPTAFTQNIPVSLANAIGSGTHTLGLNGATFLLLLVSISLGVLLWKTINYIVG